MTEFPYCTGARERNEVLVFHHVERADVMVHRGLRSFEELCDFFLHHPKLMEKLMDMPRFLKCRPLVLAAYVELPEQDRDLPVGNISRQHSGRDCSPKRVVWKILPQFSIHDGATVPFCHDHITANDDALDETTVS